MKKASFYKKEDKGKVKCSLCSHRCLIKTGKRGICWVRENIKGDLFSLVYGKVVSEIPDPIEKKPLFHFLPGSITYSISTVGCNFKCKHCQNWQISQCPHLHHGEIIGNDRTPEEIISGALSSGAKSISYTYVEPTIFYEFAYDCAKLAKQQGLKNCFVSNGFMTGEVIKELSEVLDAINIDLKAFTDKFYKEICGARLQPVLDSIENMYKEGVWVEVTTLIIPGLNDSKEELKAIARFIYSISPDIPWHVTAFYPTYKLLECPPTTAETLQMARDIGLEQGLKFVYEGNVPGSGGENTTCPECGALLIERMGFRILKNNLKAENSGPRGSCPKCGLKIPGVWGGGHVS